jgi:hypothetical protein
MRPVFWAIGCASLLLALAWVALQIPLRAQRDDPPSDAVAPAAADDIILVTGLNPVALDDGNCSLVEAIDNANADAQLHDDCPAGNGADTIRLMSEAIYLFNSVHNVADGNNGLPSITSTITVEGSGATLVRNMTISPPPFRFFHVAQDGELTLIQLGLRFGAVGLTGTVALPAVGGALLNKGVTRIIASSISYNTATYGGAIFNDALTGTLAITGSIFSFNQADVTGGAIFSRGPATVATTTMSRNQAGIGGGALFNSSTSLAIQDSTLRNNSGGSGGALAANAAMSDSNVLVENSIIFSNTADQAGGGLWNAAGDGYTATLTVRASTITSNNVTGQAPGEGLGGGIGNSLLPGAISATAVLSVTQSSVADNQAKSGGGIANVNPSSVPTPTVESEIVQSTIANNLAEGTGAQGGAGGGLFNLNAGLTVANVTVSGNSAKGDDSLASGAGGGIANAGDGLTGTLTLLNSTLATNTASATGSGLANLGLLSGTFAIAEVGNSLLVDNHGIVTAPITSTAVIATGAVTTPTVSATCFITNSTLISLGNNLEDTDTCGFDQADDQPNTPLVLGPLADNGGPTPTQAIPSPSAAADQGDDALCSAPPVSGVDQRGITRPQGSACDIGAFEATPGPTIREFSLPVMFAQDTPPP